MYRNMYCCKTERMHYMKQDIFRETLENNGLNLVYTYNKRLVLSCKIINCRTTIYANRLFNNCAEDIASAVIDLYINKNENAQNIIIQFIEQFDPKYRINGKIQNKDEKEMTIKEISISHPNKINEKLENQIINVTEDDLVELNIVVDNT